MADLLSKSSEALNSVHEQGACGSGLFRAWHTPLARLDYTGALELAMDVSHTFSRPVIGTSDKS